MTEAIHRFYDDPPMTKEGEPIKLTAEQQAFWQVMSWLCWMWSKLTINTQIVLTNACNHVQ